MASTPKVVVRPLPLCYRWQQRYRLCDIAAVAAAADLNRRLVLPQWLPTCRRPQLAAIPVVTIAVALLVLKDLSPF